jgi:hypothetical protein
LLSRLGGATAIGPILLGIRKPVYLLVPGNDVNDIVNMTAMAVFEAQHNSPETGLKKTDLGAAIGNAEPLLTR